MLLSDRTSSSSISFSFPLASDDKTNAPISTFHFNALHVGPTQSSWHCMVSIIPFLQVAVNWLNYFMIFCLLATYVKNTDKKPDAKLHFRLSLTVYIAWGIFGGWIITFAFLLYGGTPDVAPKTTGIFNNVMGLIGTISIILQWSPQIVTTFLHKGPGALSPITLSINAPGSMVTALSLILARKTFSLWLPYVLSGAQQFIIVAIIAYFHFCSGRKAKPIEDLLEHDPGFQGPALLLEEEEGNDDNDGLTIGRSPRNRTSQDIEYASPSSSYESEEDGEEVNTEDENDPQQQLIRKRRKRSMSRRANGSGQPGDFDTVSTSVPAYHTLSEF